MPCRRAVRASQTAKTAMAKAKNAIKSDKPKHSPLGVSLVCMSQQNLACPKGLGYSLQTFGRDTG